MILRLLLALSIVFVIQAQTDLIAPVTVHAPAGDASSIINSRYEIKDKDGGALKWVMEGTLGDPTTGTTRLYFQDSTPAKILQFERKDTGVLTNRAVLDMHWIPAITATYDLGKLTEVWNHAYIAETHTTSLRPIIGSDIEVRGNLISPVLLNLGNATTGRWDTLYVTNIDCTGICGSSYWSRDASGFIFPTTTDDDVRVQKLQLTDDTLLPSVFFMDIRAEITTISPGVRFMEFRDNAGGIMLRLQRQNASAVANYAIFDMDLRPRVDDSYDIGSAIGAVTTQRWRNAHLSGDLFADELGSSADRISKLWVTDIDCSGVCPTGYWGRDSGAGFIYPLTTTDDVRMEKLVLMDDNLLPSTLLFDIRASISVISPGERYLAFRDNAGAEMLRLQRQMAGAVANYALFDMDLRPLVDDSYDIGSAIGAATTQRWRNAHFSGDIFANELGSSADRISKLWVTDIDCTGACGFWSRNSGSGYIYPTTTTDDVRMEKLVLMDDNALPSVLTFDIRASISTISPGVRYMAFRDNAGAEMLRLQRQEAGATANYAIFSMDLRPDTDDAQDISSVVGAASLKRWRNAQFSGAISISDATPTVRTSITTASTTWSDNGGTLQASVNTTSGAITGKGGFYAGPSVVQVVDANARWVGADIFFAADNTYNIGDGGTGSRPANIGAGSTINLYNGATATVRTAITTASTVWNDASGALKASVNTASGALFGEGGIYVGSGVTNVINSSAQWVGHLSSNVTSTADLGAGGIYWRDAYFAGTVFAANLGNSGARITKLWVTDIDCSGVCPGGGLPVVDTTSIVSGSADGTKLMRFEVDGVSASTTRVMTIPNTDQILAGRDVDNSFSAAQSFGSTIGVTGAATLSSTLGVTGATTLSSTLSVGGNLTFSADNTYNIGTTSSGRPANIGAVSTIVLYHTTSSSTARIYMDTTGQTWNNSSGTPKASITNATGAIVGEGGYSTAAGVFVDSNSRWATNLDFSSDNVYNIGGTSSNRPANVNVVSSINLYHTTSSSTLRTAITTASTTWNNSSGTIMASVNTSSGSISGSGFFVGSIGSGFATGLTGTFTSSTASCTVTFTGGIAVSKTC